MKKLLSLILAALILACPLCSFATEAAETPELQWVFDTEYPDEYMVYTYKDALTLGDNEIAYDADVEEAYSYFTFNAENTGYYAVECSFEEGISWYAIPEEYKDGKAYGIKNYHTNDDDTMHIYEFEAGETVLGIDYFSYDEEDKTCTIKVEYLGEKITDLKLNDGALDNLIIDIDLNDYDYSWIYTDVEVIFDEENSIALEEQCIDIYRVDKWVKGENNAKICFWGFEKDVVITACETADVISDIEFVNIDDYKNFQTNFNDGYYEEILGAELVVTLADGTKVDIEDYRIELNGRDYSVYAYYCNNGPDDVSINIVFGGYDYKSIDCNTTKASFDESIDRLISNLTEYAKDFMYYIRMGISELLRFRDASDFEYALEEAIWNFQIAGYRLGYIVEDVRAFIAYFI